MLLTFLVLSGVLRMYALLADQKNYMLSSIAVCSASRELTRPSKSYGADRHGCANPLVGAAEGYY